MKRNFLITIAMFVNGNFIRYIADVEQSTSIEEAKELIIAKYQSWFPAHKFEYRKHEFVGYVK